MKGKLTLESKIPEQSFMEGLLNMKHSGVSEQYLILVISLHAMANRWKYNKLVYYLNLLELKI